MQMKMWLERREAIEIFSEYLYWSMPGYDTEATADLTDKGTTPDNNNGPSDDEPLESPPHSRFDGVSYSIAAWAPLPKTSINTITNGFHAPDFLHYLYIFLRQRDILPSNFNSIDPTTVNIPVFKRLNLFIPTLPEVSTEGHPTQDVVHACAAMPGQGLKKGVPEIFDTVFAQKDPLVGGKLKWWSSQGEFYPL